MNELTQPTWAVAEPARFSIDDFMRFVDAGVFEGEKAELVDGEIVRMNSAMPLHKLYQYQAHDALKAALDEEGGWTVYMEYSVRLGSATLRDIDVAIAKPLRPVRVFPGASTVLLAVEIADSTRLKDLGGKLRDYAVAGIPHYWVVDIDRRCTHVMSEPGDEKYAKRDPIPFGEPLVVPGTDRTIVVA